MTLDEAKEILNGCIRQELRDHAFGDKEVDWRDKNGVYVANGYFSGSTQKVCFTTQITPYRKHSFFVGDDARILSFCGELGKIERNDETGPGEFKQGQIMPALTLDGVKKEILQR